MSSPPAPYSSLLVLLTVSVPPSDDGRKVTVLVPTRSLSTTMSPVNWTVYATLPRAKVAVSAAPGTLNIQFAGSEKSPLLSVRQSQNSPEEAFAVSTAKKSIAARAQYETRY